MAGVDERSRHELYLAFEELLGKIRADTLMSLLPPVGWADVATKQDMTLVRRDIDSLEERVNLRFEKLEAHLDAKLEHELRSQTRALFFGLLTALFTMASLCIAAIAIAR